MGVCGGGGCIWLCMYLRCISVLTTQPPRSPPSGLCLWACCKRWGDSIPIRKKGISDVVGANSPDKSPSTTSLPVSVASSTTIPMHPSLSLRSMPSPRVGVYALLLEFSLYKPLIIYSKSLNIESIPSSLPTAEPTIPFTSLPSRLSYFWVTARLVLKDCIKTLVLHLWFFLLWIEHVIFVPISTLYWFLFHYFVLLDWSFVFQCVAFSNPWYVSRFWVYKCRSPPPPIVYSIFHPRSSDSPIPRSSLSGQPSGRDGSQICVYEGLKRVNWSYIFIHVWTCFI